MAKFIKKPVEIEADQWFRNGDHPLDYATEERDPISGAKWSVEHKRANRWEGEVVRYYRHPRVPGTDFCAYCRRMFHDHGWIDTVQGGHIVCPGDWIITDDRVKSGDHGHFYPCKPDVFEATYEAV